MLLKRISNIFLPRSGEVRRGSFNWLIPRSWNEVPTADLEVISKLTLEREIIATADERLADANFKTKVLMQCAGLVADGMTDEEDGTTTYHFRTREFWPWKRQYVSATADQVRAMCQSYLGWLDEPYGRLRAPYDIVKIKGRRFKGPSNKMTSLTYMQYQTAQNYLTRYWQVQDMLRHLMENGGSREAVKNQVEQLEDIASRFLATLFNPTHYDTEYRGDKKVRTILPNDFDPRQVDQFAPLFRSKHGERMLPVVMQFFLSVMRYFAQIYPDLFVTREDASGKRPDMLMLEVESMSAIMKYQGFRDYQTIYDSEAVHILKVLDNMAKESKELKRIQSQNK